MSGFGGDGWMMWWHVKGGEVCACWLEEPWKLYRIVAYDLECSKLSTVHCGNCRHGEYGSEWRAGCCRLVNHIKGTAADLLFCGAGRDKQYMTR